VRLKLVVIVAALAVSALGTSACSGGDGIAALDREATSEDQLPAYVVIEDLEVDSVRKAAESEGFTYFLARADDAGTCLIRIRDADESSYMAGCGKGTGHVTTTSLPGTKDGPTDMALVTDGYATDDLEESGWTKIQDNILVQ
jgi:hypothetical protein